ncbi:DEKNAAC101847 [Brettanomyces naardenensis]|uniref:DEKNAAC101847 n=1 Tax=Brettanomyces naardenensis TaxID=13370 RepID=A0A448YJ67_BRENA|nr:DEKNAAC101847 [Brettanomyces naardenensis]
MTDSESSDSEKMNVPDVENKAGTTDDQSNEGSPSEDLQIKDSGEKPKFRESDAGDGTVREDQILTGTRLYMCVLSLILSVSLVALDQMITAAVLTTISDHFNEFNKMTWITAAFMMPMGCCAQVWARLSISFGRKWTLLSGLVIFELGSLVAGVSTSMNMFIGGRAIQGVGAAAVQTITMVIATEITTIDKKPILFATMSLTFVFSSVLGPVIGGAFGTYASWRWCFYLNLCCSAFIFPFFILSYRPKPPVGTFMEKLKTVDFLVNFLMVASGVLILLGISFGITSDSWNTPAVISCFVIGGITLVAFCIDNFKYSKYPVIPTNLVTSVPLLSCLFIVTLNSTTMMVAIQFLSVYFQNVIGHDALHTGLSLIPCAISTGLASFGSGILIKKTRYVKIFSWISGFILPVAIGLLMLTTIHENQAQDIGFLILIGVSCGLNYQGPAVSALLHAPKTPSSNLLTMALVNFGRSVATALFSEVGGEIYSATLKSGLKKVAPLIEETQNPLQELLIKPGLVNSLNVHDRDLIRGKILVSVHDTFWLCFALSIGSLIATCFMSNDRLPKTEDVEA